AGFHVTNVLLHAASSIVLWRLLLFLEVPGAWLAAAIFALHPVEVESVAWITERKNVLSGLLYLLSAWSYLHVALPRSRPSGGSRDDRSVRREVLLLACSLLAFAGALLSKTVTATLPFSLALILFWKRRRVERRDLLLLGVMLVAGAAMGRRTAWLEVHQI